jgi:hypothetical protein
MLAESFLSNAVPALTLAILLQVLRLCPYVYRLLEAPALWLGLDAYLIAEGGMWLFVVAWCFFCCWVAAHSWDWLKNKWGLS